MSNIYKTNDSADKWICIYLAICVIVGSAIYTVRAMKRADAYSDCVQRGGQMVEIGYDRVCKVPEAK